MDTYETNRKKKIYKLISGLKNNAAISQLVHKIKCDPKKKKKKVIYLVRKIPNAVN